MEQGAQTVLPTRRSRREAERRAAEASTPEAPRPAGVPSYARTVSEPAPHPPHEPSRAPFLSATPTPVTPVAAPIAKPDLLPAPATFTSLGTAAAPAHPPVVAAAAPAHPAPLPEPRTAFEVAEIDARTETQRRSRRQSERPDPAEQAPAPAQAAAGGREKRRKSVARLGVLSALVGVTVVVPVTHSDVLGGDPAFGTDALADATLPTTVTALTAEGLSAQPPASLVSADGGGRTEATASRAELREALPGCDGSVRAAGSNGQLASADLCTLWDGQTKLRADAAVSLAEFNDAFVARFGADMCLSSGYRTLAEQRAVKAAKGSLAAAPGKSNHGWGLAVDLCSSETSGAKWTWLNENAAIYGWENPDWARPGGSGPYERWHWEYTKGVQEDGEYYG